MAICSICVDCIERTRAKLRPQARRETIAVPGLTTPTRASLEKHVARFADPKKVGEENAKKTIEAVMAVANDHGITLSVKPIKSVKQISLRRPPLKDRIREHLAEGHSIDYIAEMEDLSPSRARRLVAEIGESK
jgi:hypothetical protein